VTYCFKCPICGWEVETPVRDPAPACHRDEPRKHDCVMRRNWRAEAVGFDMETLRRAHRT